MTHYWFWKPKVLVCTPLMLLLLFAVACGATGNGHTGTSHCNHCAGGGHRGSCRYRGTVGPTPSDDRCRSTHRSAHSCSRGWPRLFRTG